VRASLAGERLLLLQIGGGARVDVGAGLDFGGGGGARGGTVKAGVNVHALASQCTVLQSACSLSCQRFHDHNCLQCPQQ